MKRPVQCRKWSLTANDHETANDPQNGRKWSSTVSDPQSRPQMIPWKIEEWNGFHDWVLKRLIRKREGGRQISGQFIQGEKKKE